MENELYRPAPHVLDRLKQVTFVAVVGPTAAGKTTLIREALKREPSIHLVLNNTSRAPRPDEQEGIDFRFETRASMEERIARGEYVQVAPSVFGDLYATAAEDYSLDGVSVLPVLAKAMPVFRQLPFKQVGVIYVLPPDFEAWQQRIVQHSFTADKLATRMAEARQSLQFALDDGDARFVINGDLLTAVDDFVTLAMDRPLSERLKMDQEKSKDLVRILIKAVDTAMQDPAIPQIS
jgi:guanylate kinase